MGNEGKRRKKGDNAPPATPSDKVKVYLCLQHAFSVNYTELQVTSAL